MKPLELNLESILMLESGGSGGSRFEKELKRCLEHCASFPLLSKARKAILQVDLIPEIDNDGFICGIDLNVRVKGTTPPVLSAGAILDIKKQKGSTVAYFSGTRTAPKECE